MISLILSSLLLGSSLGKVLALFIIKIFPFRFLSNDIPGVTSDLAYSKTFDLIDFALSIILIIVVFGFNYFFYLRKRKGTPAYYKLINIYYLVASLIIFLQSHFVEFSGKNIVITTLAVQAIYLFLILKRHKYHPTRINGLVFLNGSFVGLLLMLLVNPYTTSFAIPFIAFLTTIIAYLLLSGNGKKFTSNPSHLILALSIFFLSEKICLVIIFGIFIAALHTTKNFFQRNTRVLSFINKYLYPIAIIFIVFYNPLFYIGNLDSIEEGFWLSWLQRLINKQTIYKDFFAYHPPLIIWFIYIFTSLTQYSIYYFRLFIHLLQILGLVIFYFALDSLLKRRINKVIALLIIASLTTTTLVRNNAEMRIAVGILPIIFFYKAQVNPRLYLISGILSALAVFISVDTGIAALLAISAGIILFDRKLETIKKFIIGVFIGSLPVLVFLAYTNSLSNLLSQITFYANAFSQGYFNIPLERSIQTSFFRWHLFYEYLSSNAWFWELSRMLIAASVIYLIIKAVENVKHKRLNLSNLVKKDKYFLTLSFYGALLFRSALGRSDYHHLLFILIVALFLLFYFIEKFSKYRDNILLLSILTLLVFTNQLNAKFLSQTIFKFDTYGQVIGEYQELNSERAQILVGMETNKEELVQIVDYIQKNIGENERFFAFPWSPELYFLSDRNNTTSFDTPYAFFSTKHQEQMIEEIENNKPKIIIYDTGANFGNLTSESLSIVNDYILNNYTQINQIHGYKIYK